VTRPIATAGGVRRPVVAGSFYPADPARLAATVDRLLADAAPGRLEHPPRALVVPHAGYVYSGAVAATGWATLREVPGPVARVVLAGPAHFVPLRGACVPAASRWSTPLGEVEIDADLRAQAAAAGALIDDRPHEPEHSLEVQLPFLVRVAPPGVRVLPVAVGDMSPPAAADLLAVLADAAEAVVVSTDLSHYHDDATARRLDRHTVEAILARDADAIDELAACGVFALRGLVELARRRGWRVDLLDRRTSADAGGDPGRVVGYAALAFG
jgi:AmmeMemoRadiSam system protein B